MPALNSNMKIIYWEYNADLPGFLTQTIPTLAMRLIYSSVTDKVTGVYFKWKYFMQYETDVVVHSYLV